MIITERFKGKRPSRLGILRDRLEEAYGLIPAHWSGFVPEFQLTLTQCGLWENPELEEFYSIGIANARVYLVERDGDVTSNHPFVMRAEQSEHDRIFVSCYKVATADMEGIVHQFLEEVGWLIHNGSETFAGEFKAMAKTSSLEKRHLAGPPVLFRNLFVSFVLRPRTLEVTDRAGFDLISRFDRDLKAGKISMTAA